MRSAVTLLTLCICLALSACGGSGGTSTEPAPDLSATAESGSESEITLVAALGDSITAGTPLWDPNEQIRAQLGSAADEQSQYEYWAAREDPSLEFRNCGVNGERTDEIAQRLDVCTDGADVLIVQGGINDIAQGRPVEDAADDLRSMVQRGKDLGIPVAMVELLPWNNGHPAADPEIERLNELIHGIAEDEDVPVMPWHDALEDPDEPGTMRADLTIEGDHPSVAGYEILGTTAFVLPGS